MNYFVTSKMSVIGTPVVTPSEADLAKSASEDNGWNPTNVSTIDTWLDTSARLAFIYDNAADTARIELEKLSIALLVISTIGSMFAILQLNDGSWSPWADLFLRCMSAGLTVTTTFISGYQTVRKLPDKVTMYSKHAEKVSRFQAKTSTQIQLPPALREAAQKFITDNQDSYLSLLMEKPRMSQSEFMTGLDEYQKFSQDSSNGHVKLMAIKQLRKTHKSTSPDGLASNVVRMVETEGIENLVKDRVKQVLEEQASAPTNTTITKHQPEIV